MSFGATLPPFAAIFAFGPPLTTTIIVTRIVSRALTWLALPAGSASASSLFACLLALFLFLHGLLAHAAVTLGADFLAHASVAIGADFLTHAPVALADLAALRAIASVFSEFPSAVALLLSFGLLAADFRLSLLALARLFLSSFLFDGFALSALLFFLLGAQLSTPATFLVCLFAITALVIGFNLAAALILLRRTFLALAIGLLALALLLRLFLLLALAILVGACWLLALLLAPFSAVGAGDWLLALALLLRLFLLLALAIGLLALALLLLLFLLLALAHRLLPLALLLRLFLLLALAHRLLALALLLRPYLLLALARRPLPLALLLLRPLLLLALLLPPRPILLLTLAYSVLPALVRLGLFLLLALALALCLLLFAFGLFFGLLRLGQANRCTLGRTALRCRLGHRRDRDEAYHQGRCNKCLLPVSHHAVGHALVPVVDEMDKRQATAADGQVQFRLGRKRGMVSVEARTPGAISTPARAVRCHTPYDVHHG